MSSTDLADLAQSILSLTDPEVWIITAADRDRRGGLVATWVKPASIDPAAPSLVVAIDAGHFTGELVSAAGAFAAHLIRPDQVDLVWRFAIGTGRVTDKLAGLEFASGQNGSPLLADCQAWLDCKVYETKSTGDRTYYWADVLAAKQVSSGAPLAVQEVFSHAKPEHLQALSKAKSADIDAQRPLRAAYRKSFG